jgi:phosphomannomutase
MSVLMLGVSGCRGLVGSSLSPAVIARFAGAYGTWLHTRAKGRRIRVVIGRDGRAGSHMVHAAALAGLSGAGCDVVDIGVAMTPTVAILTDAYARGEFDDGTAYTAGMVLTASHNPQQWNGLKCLLADQPGEHGSAACAPPAVCAQEIIKLFERSASEAVGLAPWDKIGNITTQDQATEYHIDRVLDAMSESGLCEDPGQLGEGLKIAVDSVNSSGAPGARLMLEALGCDECLLLGSEQTGIFSHPPEPTQENLRLPGGLADAVREAGCDLGFAQDPDADRLAIIDHTGTYIGEEYTLALGARAVLETRGNAPETIVTNLSTSRMVEDIAGSVNGSVRRTPVGEANVVEVMKAARALIGGEGNGGVIWPRVTYVRDSLAAMALTIWLISPQGGGKGTKRPLADIIKFMPAYAIEKRKADLARKEDAAPAVTALAKAYAAEKVDLSDGCRIDFVSKRAWLHVRASNTEPIMRMIAEAPTVQGAREILDGAQRVVEGG